MKKILLSNFLTIYIFFSYSVVWGVDWQYYGLTEEAYFYYDTESITHTSNDIIRVLQKREYTETGVNSAVENLGERYRNLHHGIILSEINCKDNTSRMVSFTHYDTEGGFIYSSNVQTEWEFINSESAQEHLCEILCK